jgi:REP element-mobilizing transposase RayT
MMPFWRTYYHLVWGTKNHQETITSTVEPILFQYLINKAVENKVRVYAINGWYEHVHMVVSIPPKFCVADIVKRLKGASAYYLNDHRNLLKEKFVWQRGYGVLTVGERQLKKAIDYVDRQKEHHKNQTTNSWLERMDVEDEGPEDAGISANKISQIVRECKTSYETEDLFPF